MNPPIVKDTKSFKLVITDSVGGMLSTTKTSFGVASSSFIPGTFSEIQIKLTNPTVQESSGISLKIQPSSKLSNEGRVIITMPSDFTLNAGSPVSVTSLQSLDPTNI